MQSRKRIAELDTEIDTTVTKTARKIQTLKAQFHEHQDKWQAVSFVVNLKLSACKHM